MLLSIIRYALAHRHTRRRRDARLRRINAELVSAIQQTAGLQIPDDIVRPIAAACGFTFSRNRILTYSHDPLNYRINATRVILASIAKYRLTQGNSAAIYNSPNNGG